MPAKSVYTPNHIILQLQGWGKQIKTKRKALGVTAALAAESAAMSRQTWYRIEKGEASITIGSYMVAMDVLGLELVLAEKFKPRAAYDVLPAKINLDDYPGLKQLAWHLPDGAEIAPAQLHNLYERNQRHLDESHLSEKELELIKQIKRAYA